MRSAQFGVYDAVLLMLRKQHSSYSDQPIDKLLGIFDPNVIIAGFAGRIRNFRFIVRCMVCQDG